MRQPLRSSSPIRDTKPWPSGSGILGSVRSTCRPVEVSGSTSVYRTRWTWDQPRMVTVETRPAHICLFCITRPLLSSRWTWRPSLKPTQTRPHRSSKRTRTLRFSSMLPSPTFMLVWRVGLNTPARTFSANLPAAPLVMPLARWTGSLGKSSLSLTRWGWPTTRWSCLPLITALGSPRMFKVAALVCSLGPGPGSTITTPILAKAAPGKVVFESQRLRGGPVALPRRACRLRSSPLWTSCRRSPAWLGCPCRMRRSMGETCPVFCLQLEQVFMSTWQSGALASQLRSEP
mmetsp:Transcript_21584/g.50808  ORF Transcript_21584/g.50808 Transcript_21584/m.50808 type:complete len:289 (+) Transcript_21584:263-1129(+)